MFKYIDKSGLTLNGNKFVTYVMNDAVLVYFIVDDRTCIIADASLVTLGAVLVQCRTDIPCIISYANKGLSDAKKKYSQIEKAVLTLGCRRVVRDVRPWYLIRIDNGSQAV